MNSLLRLIRPTLAALTLTILLAGPLTLSASAQTSPTATQALDSTRASLERIERTLERPDLPDSALQSLRTELGPIASANEELLEDLQPRLEGARARLEQIGKPTPGTPEAALAATERAELQKQFDELDGQVKRARLHAVQAEQLGASIVNRRRAIFQQALFARASSVLSPRLWFNGISELPTDMRAVGMLLSDWGSLAAARLTGGALFSWLLGNIALVLAVLVALKGARQLMGRPKTLADPTPLQKAAGAVWVAVVTATIPIVAALAFIEIARLHDLFNARLEPLVHAGFDAVRRIAIVLGVTRGLLAVDRPQWRLLELTQPTAERLARLAVTVAIIVSATKIIEAMSDQVAASVAVSVLTRGVGAVAVALAMALTLYGVAARQDEAEEEFGPRLTPRRDWYAIWRLLAWASIVTILVSCAIGFVALASFIVDQIVWVTFVLAAGYMFYAVATRGVDTAFKPGSVAGRAAMNTVGLSGGSLRQIATLVQGALSLVLLVVGGMLILAPWGVESNDMLANVRAAFFGFRVGDLTVSLSTIFLALFLFAGAIVFTRMLQDWLENQYLPTTPLDVGLRNSIRTSVGYVGFFLAAAIALGYMGVSFDRLAIVAGALSVGIGFGLQSIVNNFVSGLILLWERAIRVGDLITVGDDQGLVRRINVRSTEIETSDRVTVIVPNSNLVAGVVKNWVRTDRVSRIRLPVAVSLGVEPDRVRDLLIACANAHDLVLDQPAPTVAFVAMTDTALRFELICFAGDVEKAGRMRSDLNFAIFARLREDGVLPTPKPEDEPPTVRIGN